MSLLFEHTTRFRKQFTIFAATPLSLAILLLAGCAIASPEPVPSEVSATVNDEILAKHNLMGLDAKQIIEQLDSMPLADRPTDLIASVRPDELILTDEQQQETSVEAPADEFYVSVAPYQTQTHDCYYHSLTTCVGELQNTEVDVKVTNAETGETLIDDTRSTFDNGFLGLWLPRGIEATLSVEVDGHSATTPISTVSSDDPTCITTLQLVRKKVDQ
ncbi:CueP family metal-binding protein [Leucobacter sp. W1153]|uniref:CueP family metal-binding protein n=1 Tax=Leucobacter sp. W1153 TaxID=3439064 RepID=UPI003F3FF3F0